MLAIEKKLRRKTIFDFSVKKNVHLLVFAKILQLVIYFLNFQSKPKGTN